MSHKTHPKGFRLGRGEDWQSRWMAKTPKQYARQLAEDEKIREYLYKRLRDAGIEQIEIERFPGKINVLIHTARPGLIIGRGGADINATRAGLQRMLDKFARNSGASSQEKREVKLDIREIKNPWESAALTAQWIAQQMERRMPFRRVIKQAMGKMMANKGVNGARVEIAGRLGGAEMSRKEWLHEGQMPRQTLRAKIDYGLREAQTTYGTIGVKVWMYKGEEFEE